MSESLSRYSVFPTTSQETVDKIKLVEDRIRASRQIEFVTEHVFHAGMYARTVRIQRGVIFTNVMVKCATLLIIHGDIMALADDTWIELKGYNVCPADGGRKQIYVTLTDVEMTMVFPSTARTVEEAEEQFTDESDMLLSRKNDNVMTCPESLPQPRS